MSLWSGWKQRYLQHRAPTVLAVLPLPWKLRIPRDNKHAKIKSVEMLQPLLAAAAAMLMEKNISSFTFLFYFVSGG